MRRSAIKIKPGGKFIQIALAPIKGLPPEIVALDEFGQVWILALGKDCCCHPGKKEHWCPVTNKRIYSLGIEP